MEIHNIISDRWSPVAFSKEVPSRLEIEMLFKAASHAPSSYNAQPWKFIYGIKGEDTVYETLSALLNEGNLIWASTAPVLALSIIETISPGRSSVNKFAWYDTGAAVGNLLAQATHQSLFVHQMGGYDQLAAKEVLNFPLNHEPGAMMAIGFKGDPTVLPPDVAAREDQRSSRKKTDQFIFTKPF